MNEPTNINSASNRVVLFHGGCHGCTRQLLEGVDKCIRCMYFDADWSLPDLNNSPPTQAEILRKQIKARHKLRFWKRSEED